MRWSVDEFFRELLPRIDLSDTLILYTSDHGQSLLEGGYKLSHCSGANAHPGEAIVPLMAFGQRTDFTAALRRAAQESFGKTTHFSIFPTLLLAMGYDEPWITQRYGAPLNRPSVDMERRFMTGDLFGSKLGAKWVRAD